MKFRSDWLVSLCASSVLLVAFSNLEANGRQSLPIIPKTGHWEIVAERMRVGGAPSDLGGGIESLQVCVTEEGRRISVQFPGVGRIVFDLEPGPEEHHVATLLPSSFQGVTWVLDVESETEFTSSIFGDGAGATHSQQHVWRFVEEDPSVDYCAVTTP